MSHEFYRQFVPPCSRYCWPESAAGWAVILGGIIHNEHPVGSGLGFPNTIVPAWREFAFVVEDAKRISKSMPRVVPPNRTAYAPRSRWCLNADHEQWAGTP